MRALVTVGLPGSGKSTYAAAHGQQAVELNLDLMREQVCGDATNQNATVAAVAFRNRLLNTYAHQGRDVVISDTHARRRHRKRLIRLLRKLGYAVDVVFFDVGPGTCKRRNAGRGRQVPEPVIDQMAALLREHPPRASDGDTFVVIHDPDDPLLTGPGEPCPAAPRA